MPEFRGSTGFGKAFINASNGQWGGTMHDDLMDAVAWAVKSGIAQQDKIAIMGGSYGGYATLWGLARTPDTFACGVDIFGVSSLVTMLASFPAYWGPAMDIMYQRIGDPRTSEGKKFLLSRSPITYVENIKKPLLIVHGANDVRVTLPEWEQLVAKMKERKIPVTFMVYPDEGHLTFFHPQNNISCYAVVEQFLKDHLGGRAEPIGDASRGRASRCARGRSRSGRCSRRWRCGRRTGARRHAAGRGVSAEAVLFSARRAAFSAVIPRRKQSTHRRRTGFAIVLCAVDHGRRLRISSARSACPNAVSSGPRIVLMGARENGRVCVSALNR